ncbi:hypothetical protein SASPL_113849 [Salvia splendens]|uniref:Uncharacterized protein n=1 Tax=Salvia splendens TaxID=180675 RepID=A0A8X8Y4U1_SALSN|nr:hypothetical protein SASPL_113849 [Salvia splendens]
MSKMLAVVVVTLIAFSALVEPSSGKIIGYPVIGVDNPLPYTPPAKPGSPYQRGCSAATQCRGGPPSSRKLLAILKNRLYRGGDTPTPTARKLLTTLKNVVHEAKQQLYQYFWINHLPTNGFKRACQALHGCRSNRKLLSDESEKSISVVAQATEKEAENLKFKFLSLFH